MKGFIYGKTEYSLLGCYVKLENYIKRAQEAGFDFLTITDNNLCGNYKFYELCLKNNIKPIIGLEYKVLEIDNTYSKVLAYAKNNEGYKELLNLASKIEVLKKEDLDTLYEYKNILFIYVYNDSYLNVLYKKDKELFNNKINELKKLNNFYIGYSYTNRLDKLSENEEIYNYAKENNIGIVPIHELLYLDSNEHIYYEALRKIDGADTKIEDYEDYSFIDDPNKDDDLDNFVNQINLDLFNNKIALPKCPNVKEDSTKYLKALCYKGLQKRNCYYDNYIKRLEYELNIIHKMGYDDYFLIVWDFIKYAKQNEILVGPGRGSAAGSLVAYTLGITEIDPLKYDLFFERFLNPERVSMPDIDTDFPDVDRNRVIEYVRDLYGKNHVCNITAFDRFKTKLSIRDLTRICGMPKDKADKIIDMVEEYGMDELIKKYEGDEVMSYVLDTARALEGFPRHISTHAAGIILSGEPLNNIVPIFVSNNDILYQSQLEASDLEKIGLLKMDFLGISNLTMIDGMMRDSNLSIKDLRNIPLDDKKVYDILSEGDTLGLFQLERGITNVITKLKPNRFDDLSAVIALYRPGPMQFIDEYIARRHGKKFTYINKDLEPILKSTYGILVYQEQIMQIAQKFAGYSLGEADVLRKAISKKKEDTLKSLEDDFISRTIKNGYDKALAIEIYNMIFKFANYGFNKSHSVAYALVAYQMAYFKANYFAQFIINILNQSLGDVNKNASYLKYAMINGVKVFKPNINVSSNKYIFNSNGIFIPFINIKGCGEAIASQIVEERKNGLFKSFSDFKARCPFLNQKLIEAFVYSGALDIFADTKKSMIDNLTNQDELFLEYLDGVVKSKEEFDYSYLKDKELEYLGMNIEYSIYNNIDQKLIKYKAIKLKDAKLGSEVRLLIEFVDVKTIKTKKNDRMLVGELQDETKKIRFVIFPNVLNEISDKIISNNLYLIKGKYENDNKGFNSVIIDKLALIK